MTSYEQERREKPGQGGPGVNEEPEKSVPRRGGEAKDTKESMWAASCGESRSTTEARGDWTRAPGRAELKESRPHHRLLLAAPSCFTPRRATGPGMTGRCTQVNGITSKWPLTCRSHARPEMLRPQPAGRVPAHATTPFREAPKSPQPIHNPISPCPSGACVAKNRQNLPQALKLSPSTH